MLLVSGPLLFPGSVKLMTLMGHSFRLARRGGLLVILLLYGKQRWIGRGFYDKDIQF